MKVTDEPVAGKWRTGPTWRTRDISPKTHAMMVGKAPNVTEALDRSKL